MKIIKDYNCFDEEEITKLLFGRKIEVISETELQLDNGLILEIVGNQGCGGCSAGNYELQELNGCDNAITNVEFIVDEDTVDEYDETSYKIFVLAADKRIKLLQVDGDDGNGWYGTGYSIVVKIKE